MSKLINIDGKMFRRPEAWFGLFQRSTSFDGTPVDAPLYLGTCRGAASLAPDKNRLADIFTTYNGEKIPFEIECTPYELTLVTDKGNVRFSFANRTQLLANGDPGMGLYFEKEMAQHESVHTRKNGAWEVFFRLTCTFIFKGLDGSGFEFVNPDTGKAPWEWEKLSSGKVRGQTVEAANGGFTLVMEESIYNGVVRDSYPSYAEAKSAMESAWADFTAKYSAFVEPYESIRYQTLHTLWSFLLAPQGRIKSTQIMFFAGVIGSQWQMCQNAVAFSNHPELSLELLMSPIDFIGSEGQLPDMYDEVTFETQGVKPPMHGWALLEIMKRHDILAEYGKERLEKLYNGLSAWAKWWEVIRDEDGDGLPAVVHSDETGLDDCSLFKNDIKIASPDAASYLALLFEAVGKLAELLGRSEASEWYAKSKHTIEQLLAILWDGEHFLGLATDTGEKIFSQSIIHYMPAVLGNRLPKDILAKLVDGLTTKFLSPYGLASEETSSPYYAPLKFGLGSVLPPMMLYICTGLWDTDFKDSAKTYAENYCKALVDGGMPFFIDARNGFGMYYGSSWACCAFIILSTLLSE